ncbi:Oca6p [Sugiyamaella lignohabitans]|uniref:Oca6p n=1 Tax=Sugiyamaella lignohabitans TaxID=796027 RepID=A0A167DSH9_9ASCO|nr:Oca6p [Sugiyamaella lignohabitans]ANB13240.1 Oca6p [Sugiyamaella lignohabitans]
MTTSITTVKENEGLREKRIIAPLRFGLVQPNLYRGSYPQPHSVEFLKRLGLKSIVSLTPEPLQIPEVIQFANENSIKLIHIECGEAKSKSKKKRGVPVQHDVAQQAVELMINADVAPMYIHCLNGSQVTCLVIACLRKLSFWSMASIAEEFLRYSELEAADEGFIEKFRAEISVPPSTVPWMWKGLSKTGVVRNHPTLKISETPKEQKEYKEANEAPESSEPVQ